MKKAIPSSSVFTVSAASRAVCDDVNVTGKITVTYHGESSHAASEAKKRLPMVTVG